MSKRVWVLTVTLGLFMVVAGDMHSQSLQHITYVGGTAIPGSGLHGKISIASNDNLIFEASSRLQIRYDHVISYESTNHKEVHVGLLTEGIWRLIAPWPEAKRLSLSYHDADDRAQVVVLDMSRGDEALLVEVLKTRVPKPFERPAPPLVRPPVAPQSTTAGH